MSVQNEMRQRLIAQMDEVANESAFDTAQNIFQFIVKEIQDYGCEHASEAIDLAAELYRKYVRPIDIPGIPNWAEPRFDDAVELAIVQGLHSVRAKLCPDTLPLPMDE